MLLVGSNSWSIMASDTGPPKGTVPYMTPFPIAPDPFPPKPIPDVLHSEMTPTERASARFSLKGKRAVGKSDVLASNLGEKEPEHLLRSTKSPAEPKELA